MKLAFIVPSFSADEQDWATPALDNLTRALARDHEIHIFALRYPHNEGRYSLWGAQVHAFAGHRASGLASPRLWRATVAAMLREHARAPFDCLHAFWAYEPGVVGALVQRQMATVPLIISVVAGELERRPDIDYPVQSTGLRGHGRYWYRRWLSRWALRRASRITGLSHQHLARIRSTLPPRFHERILWMPYGVDSGHFQPRAGQSAFNAAQPRLLNVGALTAVKNQLRLLEAFAAMLAEYPGAILTIVGAGQLRARLESETARLNIGEHVTFTGQIAFPEMAALYQRHDLFVQASHVETQGMALLEAGACGLPAASTPVGAALELSSGGVRLITEGAGPEEFARAISTCVSDSAIFEKMRQELIAQVAADYTLEATVRRWHDCYASLV